MNYKLILCNFFDFLLYILVILYTKMSNLDFDQKMLQYAIERHYDLAYLKLTVIIILLIIIIFYMTCKFNVTTVSSAPTASAPAATPSSERFTPSASILVNDIYNSIAGFDGKKTH